MRERVVRNKEKRRLKRAHRLIQVVRTKKENLCKLSHRPTEWHRMHLSHSYTQTHECSRNIWFWKWPNDDHARIFSWPSNWTDGWTQEKNTNNRPKRNEMGVGGRDWLYKAAVNLVKMVCVQQQQHQLFGVHAFACECGSVCMHHIPFCAKFKTETRWTVINYLVHLVLNTLAFGT